MPSPTPFYSSPQVLFWLAILGLYGTIEGVLRLVRCIPKWYRSLRNSLQSKVHDTEFYYSYRETGYIVMPGGTEFVNSRRERIVPIRRLEQVPLNYGWSGEGDISEELFPGSFRIETLSRIPGQRTTQRKMIKFDSPRERGQEVEYTLLLKCKRTGKAPEPYLSMKSPHRVDEMLLRVVFPANLLPDQVFYVRRNEDGIEQHREAIKERDALTGEFRKLIRFAEPHHQHVLEWTNSAQGEVNGQ